ncbi:MAG: zinc metallopeptidase [Thermomicrobiales bacterium]
MTHDIGKPCSACTGAPVAAVAIAAHEAGYAIQHQQGYAPLKAHRDRATVSIGSNLGFFFVLIAGVMLGSLDNGLDRREPFGLATLFALITLQVEFDASRRAKLALVQSGIVDGGVPRLGRAKAWILVLGAAAWTYVAGFLASLLSLYWVMLLTGMSRDE